MGLFDVIRYPVTDIYDDEEMSKIPEDIWHDWMMDCLKFIKYIPMPEKIDTHSSDRGILAESIIALGNDSILDVNGNETMRKMLKAYFTQDLRNRIKAYEK